MSPSRDIPLEETHILNVRDRGEFDLPIDIVCRRSATVRLSLRLHKGDAYPSSNSDSYLPISGFPRVIRAEELVEEARANRKAGRQRVAQTRLSPPPPYEPLGDAVNQIASEV